MTLRLPLLLLTICIATMSRVSFAESAVPIEAPAAEEQQAPILEFSNEANLAAIRMTWAEIQKAIRFRRLDLATDQLNELNRLRRLGGFESLQEYSLYLIQEGLDRLSVGDIDSAAFFARKALELSPRAPEVLLRSLWLVKETGVAPVVGQIISALRYSWRSPFVLIRGLEVVAYPFLWALTFALYIVLVLNSAYRIQQQLRGFSKFAPGVVRGMVGPIIAVLGLSLPCFGGPLWSIVCWTVFSALFLVNKRWAPILGGSVLMLWGAVIPLKESLSVWLEDARAQALLASNAGDFKFAETKKQLLMSFVNDRKTDGVAYFILGQELKRRREHSAADKAFEQAEGLLGAQPWTLAQRGLTAYGTGEFKRAEEFFERAEKADLATPEFLFNFSRLKFELLDIEGSRNYFTRASQKDSAKVKEFETLADQPGLNGIETLAEIRLPAYLLVRSAFNGQPGLQEKCDQISKSVMPGFTPVGMQLTGALLFLFLMIPAASAHRLRRAQAYFIDYFPSRALINVMRMIPGGAWVVAGRPITAMLIMSTLILMAFPMLGWPAQSTFSIDGITPFIPYYGWLVLLLAAGFSIGGCYLGEDA